MLIECVRLFRAAPRMRSYIRNLAQDCWTLRASCGGDIGRLAIPGLICHQGERNGFLCCRWNAEFIRQTDAEPHRLELIRQHGEHRGVLRSASGYNVLLIPMSSSDDESVQGIPDRLGRESGCRGHNILLRCTFAQLQEMLHKLPPKLLSSGRLWRPLFEKRLPQQLANDWVKNHA